MLNLTKMTEQELSNSIKTIEEQRQALVAQLEKVQNASTIGDNIVEHIQTQLKDSDEEVIKIVVGQITRSLKTYGVIMQSEVEVTTQKRTRKPKEAKEVTTIDGMVVINERFGAKKEEAGNYTVYIGINSKRSADKSVPTTGKWQQYLKEEYSTNSEVIENATVMKGKFLVVAYEMDLAHVCDLGNLNFAATPDSEENQLNANKPPLELNSNLASSNTELITESIMETEPIVINNDIEFPIGSKIRTKAYGKWMEGTITKYVPEDLAKPYRADLEGLAIEGFLAADAIELLGDLAELPL